MNLSDLYNSLFVRKSVNDGDDIDGHFELPTLHMIFLHLEWFVNSNKLEAVASLVSNSVRTKKGDVLEVFNALVEDERFLSDLITLVGDHYQYAYSAIAEGIVTIPLGLAPTYRVFKCGCVRCGTPKYIRSFCLKCGHVHDESRDVKYTQITTRKHRSRSNNNSSKAKGASSLQNTNTVGKLKCSNESPSSTALGSVSSHSSLTGAFSKLNGMKSSPVATSASATNAVSVSSNASMNSSSNNKFTVFSLQALMAAKKEKQRQAELSQPTSPAPTTALSATSSTAVKEVEVVSSTVDEVEIVVIKAQPVVIDLVSDDSDAETETHPAAPSPHTKAQTSLSSTAQHTPTKPTLLLFGSSRNHTSKYTDDADQNDNNIDDDADLVPVKMEKCSSQGSFMSECNSTIDSGDLDVDLAPVKLEWPAQRMNKYEMAAMRGIASLYKYGQSGVNPGDMLFLMRNLATNCSGLHRIAARCGFTKLCKQWAAEHPKQHLDDDSDTEESHERYVADVIEGAFTLAQLINPTNRSWAMYQETDNATASSTMTTTGPNSNNGSSNSHLNSHLNSGSVGCTGDTIWEDAEGNQESENDFAARIDLALNCSNLRFMIYSLTGDRHYQSLKSDVFEEVGAMVDLVNDGDQRSHNNASKKQRTEQSVNHTLNGFSQPIVLPVKSSLNSNTNTSTNINTNKQSSSKNNTNYNAAQQRQSRPRACNTTRSAITHLTQMETMSELYGNYDNFGNVSEAIATQFMDFAAVVTTCKYYIQQTFGKVNVWDFIGVDLDKELKETAVQNGLKRSKSSGQCNHPVSATITSADQASHDRSQRHNSSSSNNSHTERNPHRGHTFTGALCWPYIAEEVGFDIDLRNDKNTLTGPLIRHRTLSKAVSRLASRRVYHSIGHFVRSEKGTIDREAYKQQCYFVTHVIYAFSDYGQHPLRRQLFIEEYKFIVTNTATVIEVLEDAELVGEFLHCLRVLQYTPARDPDLEQLFRDGMDFLLQREKHYGCMGRWVATCRSKREDIYTQYHACYCAVVGLAGCAFAQDEELIFNPPVSRILHHLVDQDAPQTS